MATRRVLAISSSEALDRAGSAELHIATAASRSGREVHMSEARDRAAAWEARKAVLRRGAGATRFLVAAGGTTTP